jgi:hypothetical protein
MQLLCFIEVCCGIDVMFDQTTSLSYALLLDQMVEWNNFLVYHIFQRELEPDYYFSFSGVS